MAVALASSALFDDTTYGILVGTIASEDSDKIHYLANAATARMERYCQRKLKARDLTIYLDGTGTALLRVPTYPINTITSINIDETRAWAAPGNLATSKYRTLDEEGLVELYDDIFPDEIRVVKLVYNGGFASSHDQYPFLVSLCVELVSWNLKRFQGNIGTRSISGADGMNTAMEIDMPANVRQALDDFRRIK